MSAQPHGPNGLLLLDKPRGITSHDLVARVRRALNTRKVGHAGTLDPMATGLMLVGVGTATRLLTFLVGEDKVYEATVRLGATTNTEDAEGEITALADAHTVQTLTRPRIEDALERFRGEISQVPSAVSAIKVNGVRSYKRVRDGEQVALAARKVTIHELDLLGLEPSEFPGPDLTGQLRPVLDVRLRVHCSSGTYVRAIARDLGEVLGVGGHLTALRRVSVGRFSIADSVQIDPEAHAGSDCSEELATRLISPEEVARERFACFVATEPQARALRNGQRIPAPENFAGESEPVAVFGETGALIGLVTVQNGATKIVMNLPQRVVT